MPFKEHLSNSLRLQKVPLPWPRMTLSGLSVSLPLVIGYARGEQRIAIYGALLGFILILNDHFGAYKRRVLHLLTTYFFLVNGFFIGQLLSHHPALIMLSLFCMSFILAKSKGLGIELERMLLFTTLQMLNSSQNPELQPYIYKLFIYSTISLTNYIICLSLVFLLLRHSIYNPQSKRREFKEALKRKENNRYALVMSTTACTGLWLAHYFELDRSAWIVGTILIVMMPDHYQSLYKSFQRLLGTFIGVVIATLLVGAVHHPAILISFCTVFAFLAPLGLIKNYWLGNVFIAGLILFFLEISNTVSHIGHAEIAMIRITDISLGCILGVIGTLIAFPQIFKNNKA